MLERDFLSKVLSGDTAAVDFCLLLGSISQVWDDLVDGDTPVTDEDINRCFFAALIELPANPFYYNHFTRLHPILMSSIFDWMAANELEKGAQHDKTLSFVLRDNLCSVVTMSAAIVGGPEWAILQAPTIRRFFHDETLALYLQGHDA